MQAYCRGAPPNFHVDRAGKAINFAEVCGTSISGEGYVLSKCLSLTIESNFPALQSHDSNN